MELKQFVFLSVVCFLVLLCFLHLFFYILNIFWIVFASSSAFAMYNRVVEFCAVFIDKLAVAGCIVLSDGFAIA